MAAAVMALLRQGSLDCCGVCKFCLLFHRKPFRGQLAPTLKHKRAIHINYQCWPAPTAAEGQATTSNLFSRQHGLKAPSEREAVHSCESDSLPMFPQVTQTSTLYTKRGIWLGDKLSFKVQRWKSCEEAETKNRFLFFKVGLV